MEDAELGEIEVPLHDLLQEQARSHELQLMIQPDESWEVYAQLG